MDEGYRCVEATIFDGAKNKAIDSVKCEVATAGKTVYSDTAGKIDVCDRNEWVYVRMQGYCNRALKRWIQTPGTHKFAGFGDLYGKVLTDEV